MERTSIQAAFQLNVELTRAEAIVKDTKGYIPRAIGSDEAPTIRVTYGHTSMFVPREEATILLGPYIDHLRRRLAELGVTVR